MDRDSPELVAADLDVDGLQQQLMAVTEHRSRIMVLLTERSREIADLTTELGRARAEALRHLEDSQSSARQLRRVNDKVADVVQSKHALEAEHHRTADALESVRLELSATKTHSSDLERDLRVAQGELTHLRQELDATRRTLEAQTGVWEQERGQFSMTLTGLTLEIQSEHQAARILERRWVVAQAQPLLEHERPSESTGVDLRLAHAQAVQDELAQQREERASLSDKVRDLERDAGASRELARLRQELRNTQVEKNLLERRLEDAEARDRERE